MKPIFPELKENEVALVRAEQRTGHVLDEEFNLAMKEEQVVFSIFENEDEALNYAKSVLQKRPNLKCVIYGLNETVLHYICK